MPSAPTRRLAFPKTILVDRAGAILATTRPEEGGKVRIAVDYDTAEESNNSATEAEANISEKKVLQRSTRKKEEMEKMTSVAEKEQTVGEKMAVEVKEAAIVPAKRGPKRRKPARDPLRPRRPGVQKFLNCPI